MLRPISITLSLIPISWDNCDYLIAGVIKENKHIKVVTRDRASEYAKVIQEELPDAMQVADRFHLHQNFF